MNERRKKAMEFLSEYQTIIKQKKIIDEQMFSIAELYRGLAREESSFSNEGICSNEEHSLYEAYKNKLEQNLRECKARHGALFLRQRLIMSIVDHLSDAEKIIVRRFFLSGDSRRASDELMESLSFEKTHIYRLKDKALDKVADLMDAFPRLELISDETGEDT